MPLTSSCWMPPENSQFDSRLPQANAQSGSWNVVMRGSPHASSAFAPISSPFGAGLVGSPCTRPSPGMHTAGSRHTAPSSQVRLLTRLLPAGLTLCDQSVESRLP